jgi:hypothetical protein
MKWLEAEKSKQSKVEALIIKIQRSWLYSTHNKSEVLLPQKYVPPGSVMYNYTDIRGNSCYSSKHMYA